MRDEEIFSDCLVDGDRTSARAQRRARHRALTASLILECAGVAGTFLLPIFAAGRLPHRHWATPSPPYPGSLQRNSRRAPGPFHPSGPKLKPQVHELMVAPRIPPAFIKQTDASQPSDFEVPTIGAEAPGVPGSLLPPIATPDGRAWFVKPPVPPAPQPRLLQRSEGVQQASLIHRVVPVYPELARAARIEGVVRLHAIIGRDGTVRSLEVVSGQALLAQAALEAVRQWRYRPTLLHGQPVEVETFITVIFRLEQ